VSKGRSGLDGIRVTPMSAFRKDAIAAGHLLRDRFIGLREQVTQFIIF